MKRLVILDPGLLTVLSHHYSEANALVREARTLGIPARVVCHREASGSVRNIPAEPFFRQHSYGHLADSRPAADFMAIHFCNQSTLKDLQALTTTLTSDDVVLFPTVTCNIVLGICQWLNQFDPADAPRFGLCLMFPPDTSTEARPSAVAAEISRQAFARIPRAIASRLVFTCELDVLSDAYKPLLGVRPLTLPIPTWAAASDEPSGRHGLRISFLGGGRTEKGFHWLPAVIAFVRARRPAARFLVQAVGHDADLIESVAAQLGAHQDVLTLIRHPMTDDELRTAMTGSSLVLLPYDRERYGTRGSSLYTEARRVGVPMVLPAGTVFGEEGRQKGIATTFEEFTAPSIAGATIQAIDQWDNLVRAAARERRAEQAKDTGYVAALLDRLSHLA